jgi:hypothetical protein
MQVAIVTGGSSGIGQRAAIQIAKRRFERPSGRGRTDPMARPMMPPDPPAPGARQPSSGSTRKDMVGPSSMYTIETRTAHLKLARCWEVGAGRGSSRQRRSD